MIVSAAGPDEWQRISPHCSGRSQSPINIITRKVLPDGRLTPFHFDGYQTIFHGLLVNNGHTVQLDLPAGLGISGGNLTGQYKAVHLHLHWGQDGGPGSEHAIDGERFPMEMHIVHIKEEYSSLFQAVRDRSGVAVLGFFFQESESTNKKYVPLINALKYILQPTNTTTLPDISLDMFIPPKENMTKYLRYDGSLTTPDCDESVVWSLFENTIPLSRQQLTTFSQLWFQNRRRMVKTYRPMQPMNGRQVYYSDSPGVMVSPLLLLMAALLSSVLSLGAAE
ncbi:carbonic anhydrase 4b [Xenentodon cancila]